MTIGASKPDTAPDLSGAASRARDEHAAKVHWTQRPENAEKVREANKKRAARKGKGAKPESDDQPVPGTSPSDIAAASLLSKTVWGLAGPMFHFRPLNGEQADRMGAALAPVLAKYLPSLDRWSLELNLAVVVYQLGTETREPRSETKSDSLDPGNEGERQNLSDH